MLRESIDRPTVVAPDTSRAWW